MKRSRKPVDLIKLARRNRLSAALLTSWVEAAAVCNSQRNTGRIASWKFDKPNFPSTRSLVYPELTDQLVASYADLQEATELGAQAIAMFALEKFFDRKLIQRAAKGGGYDFYVSQSSSGGANFLDGDKCEVSGILNSKDPNEVSKRVKEKQKRLSLYGTLGTAYIVVADFRKNRCKVVVND